MNNQFYVYVYLNPLKQGKFTYMENGFGIDFDYEPFYIGKGKDYRLFSHLYESFDLKNFNYKVNTIRYIWKKEEEPIIYKIYDNLNEKNSHELEKVLIKIIGREDKNLGSLLNLTDGGDGTANPSNETRKKLGNSTRGKTYEEIHGIEKAKELKKERSFSSKGRIRSPETTFLQSQSMKGKSSNKKGKTFEELYGKEKANELKENQRNSVINTFRNKTENEKQETIEKIKETKKNRSLEKELEVHKNLSACRIGSKNPSAKKYIFINSVGEEFLICGEFKKFCNDNNINLRKIRKVIKGEIDNYKGWKCIKLREE